MAKSKPTAVSPDLAESTPALPHKSKKAHGRNGSTKTGSSQVKKRPVAEMGGDDMDSFPKKKRVAPPPKRLADSENALEGGSEQEQDESEMHLHGFSSGSDSSDEDEDDDGIDSIPIEVTRLPTIAKDDASVKRKLEKAKKQPTTDCGVLYLGRIPHGFYEDQMKEYFTQFGEVTRLRLSRNKKTGRSKHYAFIEFQSSSVAQIVSETMDNYLLMGHILVCKVVPKEEVHPELWVGSNRKWRMVPTDRVVRVAHNRERGEEEQKQIEKRLLKRQRQKQQRLKDAGIDYDLSPVGYSARPVTA